jgi:hypothetical protein
VIFPDPKLPIPQGLSITRGELWRRSLAPTRNLKAFHIPQFVFLSVGQNYWVARHWLLRTQSDVYGLDGLCILTSSRWFFPIRNYLYPKDSLSHVANFGDYKSLPHTSVCLLIGWSELLSCQTLASPDTVWCVSSVVFESGWSEPLNTLEADCELLLRGSGGLVQVAIIHIPQFVFLSVGQNYWVARHWLLRTQSDVYG